MAGLKVLYVSPPTRKLSCAPIPTPVVAPSPQCDCISTPRHIWCWPFRFARSPQCEDVGRAHPLRLSARLPRSGIVSARRAIYAAPRCYATKNLRIALSLHGKSGFDAHHPSYRRLFFPCAWRGLLMRTNGALLAHLFSCARRGPLRLSSAHFGRNGPSARQCISFRHRHAPAKLSRMDIADRTDKPHAFPACVKPCLHPLSQTLLFRAGASVQRAADLLAGGALASASGTPRRQVAAAWGSLTEQTSRARSRSRQALPASGRTLHREMAPSARGASVQRRLRVSEYRRMTLRCGVLWMASRRGQRSSARQSALRGCGGAPCDRRHAPVSCRPFRFLSWRSNAVMSCGGDMALRKSSILFALLAPRRTLCRAESAKKSPSPLRFFGKGELISREARV